MMSNATLLVLLQTDSAKLSQLKSS